MPKTIKTKVVGVSFGNGQELIEYLSEGDSLFLEREPENEHDENAIAVYVDQYQNEQIGYLSSDLAEELAPQIDSGQMIMAEVTAITGEGERTRGVNILLTLYSKEETQKEIAAVRAKYAHTQPEQTPQPAQIQTPALQPARSKGKQQSDKNIFVVLGLWLFLGYLGAHRIYVGRGSWIYTLTLGYFLLGWIFDLLLIITKSFNDRKGKPVWF